MAYASQISLMPREILKLDAHSFSSCEKSRGIKVASARAANALIIMLLSV